MVEMVVGRDARLLDGVVVAERRGQTGLGIADTQLAEGGAAHGGQASGGR